MAARPPAAPSPAGRQDVQQQVVDWRRHVLCEAGYPDETADRVARSDCDLHRAVEMLASGCPPELAERILV
jgi:hypothetical protein